MAHIGKVVRRTILQSPIGNCTLLTGRELSFAIMTLVTNYAKDRPDMHTDAIGAIESAKNEFYQKHVRPFEDQQEFENGSVD